MIRNYTEVYQYYRAEGEKDHYQKHLYKGKHQRHRMKALKNLLSKLIQDSFVLDVGCAEGWYTVWMAKSARFVIGIDFSLPKLKRAVSEANASNVSYVLADWDHLPFAPETFQIVLWTEGPEHSFDPVKTMEGIFHILERKGMLLLSAPIESTYGILRRRLVRFRRKGNLQVWDGHLWMFTARSFKRVLSATKFLIRKYVYLDPLKFDFPFRETLESLFGREKVDLRYIIALLQKP